ncbi:hypothetical protein TIFTF001_055256, partial [Ficus carica]
MNSGLKPPTPAWLSSGLLFALLRATSLHLVPIQSQVVRRATAGLLLALPLASKLATAELPYSLKKELLSPVSFRPSVGFRGVIAGMFPKVKQGDSP